MIPAGQYHVLVVEDNPGDFMLVKELISEQAAAPIIRQAQNFREAVKLLAAGHSFNIVLLDLSLPDHSGEPLIHEMVALCGNVPVIVLTGYVDFGFGVRSLAMGIADYLLKDELTAMALYKSMVYSTERKKISLALAVSEKRVRSFANQLNNVLEGERSRIAREIHDEFGQQLTGLKMSLSALKKFNGADAEKEALIDALVSDVNTSIASVRQIANELRPVLLDKLGLFPAIEWLAKEFERKTGILCSFYLSPNILIGNEIVEINIFRICQEALTNITKHAQATLVILRIEIEQEGLVITITDNGLGIQPGVLSSPLSMGFLNMEERAQLIGAKFSISRLSPTGTIIKLILNSHGQ